jgi:flagellar hook-length control protein FliK
MSLAASLKPVMDAPATAAVSVGINTPFGKSDWTKAVAQQVMVMVNDKVQTISLALNPPNLGPLQVVVKIENQVANVQFSSAAPEVLQALREGLPVLQDMLGQAGVALGQADIGQRQPQRGQKNNPAKPNESSASPDAELIPSIHNAQTDLSYRQGLVNLYA